MLPPKTHRLSQDRLKELFTYDKDSGLFTRIKHSPRSRAKIGDIAKPTTNGYVMIGIDGAGYLAHRLAFLYETGGIPEFIDHIDGNRSNNSFSNLRECDRSQNACNRGKSGLNTSGYKGVYFNKNTGKWHAQIKANDRVVFSNGYQFPQEAHEWYIRMAKHYHKEFARTD